ncbi:hypothetical protein GGI04_005958, partial [Coemansia thaxteri]
MLLRSSGWIALRQLTVLVTTPYVQPLESVENADELIVMLADAMRAHGWVLEKCRLFHCDISSNNIMIERKKDADGNLSANGMLIDFDYAIDPNTECIMRPERTGTLPYMSALNLEEHASWRTKLDNW